MAFSIPESVWLYVYYLVFPISQHQGIVKVLNVPFAFHFLICKKLMLLLSRNLFEDSFVYESIGDPREIRYSCKSLLDTKLHLFPRKMCFQISAESSVCELQPSATDVPAIYFFHAHPCLPTKWQTLV